MPLCNNCGLPFTWGFDKIMGRWIPLEPVDRDQDLDKGFVDENGRLRADHRDRCAGEPSINVTRLEKKIPAGEPTTPEERDPLGERMRQSREIEAREREEADLAASGKDVYGSLE